MHSANRHVERWAPETNASRVRSMRSLGFVDRLIAPWLETSQRSMGLRMFSSPTHVQTNERNAQSVSWVFPRPWYQDELDWMAAAREQTEMASMASEAPRPSMLTTRGTYVAPQAQLRPSSTVMPSALYEYVAPSLSIAQPSTRDAGYPSSTRTQTQAQPYSPLVSLAAVQAADLMNRAIAPLMTTPTAATANEAQPAVTTQMGRVSPALRTVLTTMLERASIPTAPTQVSTRAPEMVTPPAPSAADDQPVESPAMTMAQQVATDLHTQRVQMAQVQAIAQQHQQAARVAEAQVVAQRAEVERQRTEARVERAAVTPSTTIAPTAAAPVAPTAAAAPVASTATAITTPTPPADVERARLEDRVLQRVAERVAAQRLHETARAEAAVHARSFEERRDEAPAAPVQPPAEILAAIAALPPQLAAALSEGVLRQPGGAVRAIAQVNEALRAAELMAYSAATNAAFEPTRGPRLVMPAGIGGLVSAVDRAHGPTMMAPSVSTPSVPQVDAPRAQAERAYRVPTLPWVTAPTAPTAIGSMSMSSTTSRQLAPTSALGAATTAAPQALTQLAWADRWLARFAGASSRSLEAMQVASSTAPLRQLAISSPETVFVSALFDDAVDVRETRPATATSAIVSPTAATAVPARMPTLIPAAPPPIQRFDDSAETPDDVFAQISQAATRNRKAPAQPVVAPAVTPAVTAAPTALVPAIEQRPTYADHVAHAVPSAPNAGLAAQLASSPFAPALRHVLALPSAPSFDVRSLFGGGLSASYLAGLLSPSSHELAVANPMPAWAQWSPAAEGRADAPTTERAVPSFDAAYVAPDDLSAADTTGAPSTIAPSVGSTSAIPSVVTSQIAARETAAPLTTLRSALLSWTADVGPSAIPSMVGAPAIESVASRALAPSITASPAQTMLQSMSMPMVGETQPSAIGGWTQPGAIADRAFGYSLAHERSTADLSFDFVPPELVLAARVYGLGPAEAAQAARLALAGPGQLGAMANTVDRTFVSAMAIEAERREGRQSRAITTAFPSKTGEIITSLAPAAPAMPLVAPSETPSPAATAAGAPGAPSAAPAASVPTAPMSAAMSAAIEPFLLGSATHSAFGVDRRAPRGAFLWPAATVAALGLTASTPDGEQSMSVAALELLAAQAVAEIGTYAALYDDRPSAESTVEGAPRTESSRAIAPIGSPVVASAPAAERTEASTGEPAEADVLGAAGNMIAPTRRARFDALYVALSQSPSGRNLSPAARAARALALAGRGDDAPTSAVERASTVWDVLPVVYATEGMSTEEAVHTQAELGANTPRGIAARAALRRPGIGGIATEFLASEGRPGLAPLSSRAGEALASYVTSVTVPTVPVGATASSTSSAAAQMMRGPSTAQELVQTGRPSGRHGGGETEIPPWFEAAARKMLGERMGTESLSLAELTLVNNAPATQIAAASKTGHVSAAPTAPGAGGDDASEGKKGDDDVDALAEEVYSKILIMIDAARSRNGEPYL